MTTLQKAGYPNLSIKLYEDYTAWNENRFIEMVTSLTTLTMRDGLYGINEGILQVYDNKNLHTKLNGNQIIQISFAKANTKNVINRLYGCKSSSVSVDEKGDNIIAFNLAPIHIVDDIKFSRAFFSNATESLETMIKSAYMDKPEIAPKINGINVYIPRVPWVSNIKTYMEYVREVGLAVDSETHPFVWEDINGINVTDYASLIAAEPIPMLVGDPAQVGMYIQSIETPIAYDFIWLTKTNAHIRDPLKNVTVFSHSFNDKEIQKIIIGNGENAVVVSRSGGYSEMTYRNGYEEAFRLATMAQYDGYATCKVIGEFNITPGTKLNFGEKKNQFQTDFYVDEVIHVFSNNTSETHLYMFTNSVDLIPLEIEKVKNEIENFTPPSDSVAPEPLRDTKGAQWNLDILASTITKLSTGRKSTGQCALYVRKALQAAQLGHFFSGGLGNANEMAPKLVNMGWISIGTNVTNFKKGDISVFNKTNSEAGQKYGHIAIYNGSVWISDFVQSGVQPNSRDKLTYTVYRARNGYTSGE